MELQSTSNFCMLTEHLHTHFKRYIINGRERAPPEFELQDMIPTFQQGAKTNRRALQSKFKSWAKRMTILNDDLALSSSGKIIIPQERCEEIIMELHCDNHMSIEKVVTRLQKKYTWTKKNFGMDLGVVINAISNNCKNAACKKELGKVIKTYFKKLFQGFPVSTDPQKYCQNSDAVRPKFYDCSMETPQHGGVSRIEYPILQSCLSNRDNTLTVLPEGFKNQMKSLTKVPVIDYLKSKVLSKTNQHFIAPKKWNILQSANILGNQRKNENRPEKVSTSNPLSLPSAALHKDNWSVFLKSDDSSRNSYSLTRSCKKPRNLDQYMKQLKDAQIYPETYPAIFTEPKSQFLSTLGLVPKRICSKRTLVKFTREQRKKRLMEKRRSWFVGERKGLRDRNKLNKRSYHYLRTRTTTHGRISKPLSSSFHYSPQQKTRYNFRKLKSIIKQPLRGQTETTRMTKQRLIFPKETAQKVNEYPEIIDISLSDDEAQASQNFSDVKTEMSQSENLPNGNFEQNGSFQYADPMLFGYNAENAEALRNQMFYGQNFGYNGVFGAPNIFLSQNNVINFPVTSANQLYYMNSQTQFPLLRPFFIPAIPNSDIAVVQGGDIPMIRPLGPITSPNTSSYFKTTKLLPNNPNSFCEQPGSSAADKNCLFEPNGNVVTENKESCTNTNSVQPNQTSESSSNFKVFIVNKTPNKTYLLVPPNCKAYLNTAKKIIPMLDRKQPIAPRINGSEKSPMNYKTTVAQELQRKPLNNTLSGCTNYNRKQKEGNKDIQKEMARLSHWINKVKTSITPTSLHRGVEKFSNRLTNDLNVGIALVKGVRNTLIEIENNEEDIAENTAIFESIDK